eukprot:gene1384-32752_t
MRQLIVQVPADREAEVLECLQDECKLKNVSRQSDGVVAEIKVFVDKPVAGKCLHKLDLIGVGSAYGKVSMLPVLLHKPIPRVGDKFEDHIEYLGSSDTWNVRGRVEDKFEDHIESLGSSEAWNVRGRVGDKFEDHIEYLGSSETWNVRGRLSIEEMYTNISEPVSSVFDYVVLCTVAGWISAVGLATNSSVMIVASMLISPIMGPILMFCFGTSIQDYALIKRGIMLETIGVLVCFFAGIIAGFFCAAWIGVPHEFDWPTSEMTSRGGPKSLISGVMFAIPSGMGVAMSTSMGGATAIVGVAIAASLLPPVVNSAIAASLLSPVVNSGMALSFAWVGTMRDDNYDRSQFYEICWCSIALYFINIICIYFSTLFIYWIKAIAGGGPDVQFGADSAATGCESKEPSPERSKRKSAESVTIKMSDEPDPQEHSDLSTSKSLPRKNSSNMGAATKAAGNWLSRTRWGQPPRLPGDVGARSTGHKPTPDAAPRTPKDLGVSVKRKEGAELDSEHSS